MQCDFCGSSNTKTIARAKLYQQAKDWLIIDEVPIVKCKDCNQKFLTAETLKRIDTIKQKAMNAEPNYLVKHYKYSTDAF